MHSYQTTSTVELQGQVHLAGVPFAPGTEVDVKISPKRPLADAAAGADDQALVAAREQMRALFRTIKGFRNSPRISREELYDRGNLR